MVRAAMPLDECRASGSGQTAGRWPEIDRSLPCGASGRAAAVRSIARSKETPQLALPRYPLSRLGARPCGFVRGGALPAMIFH